MLWPAGKWAACCGDIGGLGTVLCPEGLSERVCDARRCRTRAFWMGSWGEMANGTTTTYPLLADMIWKGCCGRWMDTSGTSLYILALVDIIYDL